MVFDFILTKVRAALIGFLLPTTALMEAEAIRPAMLYNNMIYKFIFKLLLVDALAVVCTIFHCGGTKITFNIHFLYYL